MSARMLGGRHRRDLSSPDGTVPVGPLIALRGVEKVYRSGRLQHPALRGVTLDIESGEFVAMVGPSGSGKSTVLNILTGIDRPTAGSVFVDNQRIDEMSEEDLALWRGANVGIVFQFFQLLPTLTALENATLPFDLAEGPRPRDADVIARKNLELVGLGDRLDHFPSELSGGEQQRVAIARALARRPQIIVADEPTGNLDSAAARHVLEVLAALNREGATVIFVTHNADLAAHAHRVVTIHDGLVSNGEVTS